MSVNVSLHRIVSVDVCLQWEVSVRVSLHHVKPSQRVSKQMKKSVNVCLQQAVSVYVPLHLVVSVNVCLQTGQ